MWNEGLLSWLKIFSVTLRFIIVYANQSIQTLDSSPENNAVWSLSGTMNKVDVNYLYN